MSILLYILHDAGAYFEFETTVLYFMDWSISYIHCKVRCDM